MSARRIRRRTALVTFWAVVILVAVGLGGVAVALLVLTAMGSKVAAVGYLTLTGIAVATQRAFTALLLHLHERGSRHEGTVR